MCLPKQFGGLGLKQLGLWNTAAIGKQVWALAMKKDSLWVRWISSIYLRHKEFIYVQAKMSDSWHWKQLLKARDQLAPGFFMSTGTDEMQEYTTAAGYQWLLGSRPHFRFAPAL